MAGFNEDVAGGVRSAVMEYMYYGGRDFWRLSESQWQELYLMADGFGKVDRTWANEQCWDWSHVRDSSEAAFGQMWDVIRGWHNNGPVRAC